MDYSEEIARAGLEIGAIKLRPSDPFTWASGFRMPIYNDNRMFLFHPEVRNLVEDAFAEEANKIGFDVYAGTSTAGIPWASFLSRRFDEPMVYVRDKPKDHGLRNQIEGIDAEKDLSGHVVLLIEDLIFTGGSSARAVQAIRDANGVCNYCVSVFNYGLDKGAQAFASLDPKCEVVSLLTYDKLLEVAKETGYIKL